MGCSRASFRTAERMLRSGKYNTGLTYSNTNDKCSVVVIGLTTSPEEFQNTFDHEKGHLAMHISSAFGLDVYGEEYQYLTGAIGQEMFKIAKKFLCEHCRKKLILEVKDKNNRNKV